MTLAELFSSLLVMLILTLVVLAVTPSGHEIYAIVAGSLAAVVLLGAYVWEPK